MKRKLILFALALAAWQLLAAEAKACSCLQYGTPACAAYWDADAVFAGVVTDVRKIPKDSPDAWPEALLRFVVEDAFRGLSVGELDVATPSGTSCDVGFRKGERWLVYAQRDAATGRLVAHPCTRTHRLAGGTDEDLDYIRGLRRGAPGQSVLGRLVQNGYARFAGVKVSVVGPGGQSFETETDAEGDFAVRLERGGSYTVRFVVPFAAGAMSHTAQVGEDATDERTVIEYPVEIADGRCVYNEVDVYKVDLHATAEVGGRVLDEDDRPVMRGRVLLQRAEPKEGSDQRAASAEIQRDGGFKFERVAVGNYYLVVNPDDEAPGDSDAPHPRTFYPGVAEQSKATPVVVTEGLKLEGLIFRVPTAMRERFVTGVVVWPGGRPAAGARITLYEAGEKSRYIGALDADGAGRFTLSVYGDFRYEVSARVYGKKVGESGNVKVPGAGDTPYLKLVLKPAREKN